MKKVTLKDIAKEANVSVATVSYVLNRVSNQTIPDETKQMIFDIAKRLNYVPNLAARSLIKRKSGLIGILVIKDEQHFWKDLSHAVFIQQLEKLCNEQGYHVVISSVDAKSPKVDIIVERELDGVFVIDVDSEVFYQISQHFGVPIVILNSDIQDDLFHQISPDYAGAMEQAKRMLNGEQRFLVTDSFNNARLLQDIKGYSGLKESQIHVMGSVDELRQFLAFHEGEKGIVINEFIGAMVAHHMNPADLVVIGVNGCSPLLPPEVKKVEFRDEAAVLAWDIMQKHIQWTDFTSSDKQIKIPTI